MKTNSAFRGAANLWRRGEVADDVGRVREVVRGPTRRRFQSVRVVCSLALPGLLALGTIKAYAQSMSVFQSVFPMETRLGSSVSASGGVFNTSPGTVTSVFVTLTASPSGKFKNLMAFPASVTYTSVAPNYVVFNVGNLGPSQSASLGYDFVPDVCTSYNLDMVATASNAPAGTNSKVVVIIEPFSRYYIAGVQVPAVKDPVSGFSGKEVYTEAPDFNLGGPGLPIFFQRHYDGALFEDGVINSALGPNWQHNYDITLNVNGTNATVGFRQGRILRFEHDGANWNLTERRDIPFRLLQNGGDFTLGDPRSQFMYFFDSSGKLVRIEDGKGNTNFLSYNGTLLTNVNDGLNRQLTLQYDGSSQLTNVSDSVRSVGFTHGSPLASAVDALGFITSYSYTTNTNNPALLTARTLPEGNTPFAQTYNAQGRVNAQTDGAGHTTTIGYGPATGGRQTSITNPLGHVTIQFHTADGEFSQLTDAAGQSIFAQQEFNTGRRSVVRDRFNNQTRLFYDETNGFPNRIDIGGTHPDESFAYSPRVVNGFTFFDLTRTIHPDGSTNLFGHDAQGNLTSHTNRTGDVWRYGRNARGQLLSVTNPLGGTASFTYDANARPTSATDSDVGVTTYEYDALNRLTKVTHPHPSTVQFGYDALNRLTSVIDERTNATAFHFDSNSRLTNILNALGQSRRIEYDAVDRVVRTVDRLGHSRRFAYDPRSLLSAVTNRNGFVTRLDYDARQRLTAIVNPANVTNRMDYDEEGLLIAVVNALGETTRFQRDVMGYVTNVFDELSNKVSFARDAMKRVTGRTNALGQKATFTYDRRGLLTNTTREVGIAATYRRNPLGLVTNIIDPKSGQWNFAYTPMGRLASFADPLGRSTTYQRDVRGRINRIIHPNGITQTNIYDGANNLLEASYSDSTAFQFAFDPLDRLTNAAASAPLEFDYDAESRPTNTRQEGLNFGATYDAGGRLTSASYSNGFFIVNYTYDSRDRLIHVSDNLTGHGMGFGYNDADRLVSITRSNGIHTTYTYEARGLITRIQEGSIVDLRYTFDADGKVTEADYVAAPLDPSALASNASVSFTYDAASQISSGGLQYDAHGRLTNSPTAALQWDAASRLVGIGAVQLAYNALDDLVTRVEGGVTNHYFYNYALGRSPIVAERNDNTGQFVRFHVWSPSGVLLYIVNLPGNTVSYPHFDRAGSTLALTDGAGAVTDAYAYDPYGRLLARTGSSQQPFQFVGRSGVRTEPAAGLWHMRARYYDPRSARFLSREPIWPDLANPRKLNPYQYALQNPLGLIDPRGTDGEDAQKPVDELKDHEVVDELVERLIVKNERLKNGSGPGGTLTEKDKKRIRKHIERDWHDDGREKSNIWDLRDRLEDLREEAAGYAAEDAQRAADEARRQRWGDLPPYLQKLVDELGFIPTIGSPAPSQAPTPVVPLPVPTPETPSDPKPEEEYGFHFGGPSGDGVPVSYTSPDSPNSYVLPLSPKIQSMIFGGNGALNYQGPTSSEFLRGVTSEADAVGSPLNDDSWLRNLSHY